VVGFNGKPDCSNDEKSSDGSKDVLVQLEKISSSLRRGDCSNSGK
jgi:hypothetical protein